MFMIDLWIICASLHLELIVSFKLSSSLCLVLVFLVEIYELELLFPCPLLSLVRDLDIRTLTAIVRRYFRAPKTALELCSFSVSK